MALRIRQLRQENGITQKDLAARLFVTPQAISKWEKDLATPNPETLVKLAEIFNCSVDHLCGLDGIEQANKGFYTVDEYGNRHSAMTAEAPVSNSGIKEKTAAQQGSGQQAEFTRLFESLSPQQQKTALAMLRALKDTE